MEHIRMDTEKGLDRYRDKSHLVILEQANQIKTLESNNKTSKLNYHIKKLKKTLKRDFDLKENQIQELLQMLEESSEQFERHLSALLKEVRENSEFHKKLDRELSMIHQKLLADPYNFKPNGLDGAVKIAFLISFFIACEDYDNFEIFLELYKQYFVKVMGLSGDLMDIAEDDIGKLCAKVCNKYKNDRRIFEYAVQLACNVPSDYYKANIPQ